MLFNSFTFAIFFIIVLILYYIFRNKFEIQNVMLLAASYVFYGWWNWKFLSLLLLSTTIDYYCGAKIYKTPVQKKKKAYLAVSIVSNLTILGFFKYYNFFVTNLADLLYALGLHINLRTMYIILPVGISFYTFQAMSYGIDIYRNKLKPAKSFFDFALFISFFPQLVAGPIVRALDLLPQIEKPRKLTKENCDLGFWLIIWGLFKKIVIADNCALIVDRVFLRGSNIGGGDVLIGTLFFAFQIYADFSGYSDMAIGLAKVLGFHLKINFNLPYFAVNPSDFWQRWHISLSSWMRDYLYIPLGGNKTGSFRTGYNLMTTMFLCGLWHGASWTFVLWGMFHGVFLVAHRLVHGKIKLWTPMKMLFMFGIVNFGWLLFRSESLGQWGAMLRLLLSDMSVKLTYPAALEVLFYIAFLMLFQIFQYRKNDLYFISHSQTLKLYLYPLVLLFIVLSGQFTSQQFIYFQF